MAVYKDYLKANPDTYDDPFLTGPVSEAEALAIEEYQSMFTRIKEGEEYFDLSSPLNCMLSFYSACRYGDSAQIRRIQAKYEIKAERLPGYAEWLEEIYLWRVPAPPEKPEPGQIWPIYMKNKKNHQWEDTFLFQYWKGEWKRWGNMGGPFYDWRDSSLRMQKDFLVKKIQSIE